MKRFGAVVALDGVSLEVRRGECVALIGESGSGKTTLLRCFNRLVDPDAGARAGRAAPTRPRWTPSRSAGGIGYVPQEGGLLPHWRGPPQRGAGARGCAARRTADGRRRARAAPGGARARALRRTAGPASSPAASASGWRSRARWPPVPRSSCSTSRSARSTRSPAPTSRPPSSASAASWDSPPCWSPTISPRRFLLADRVAVLRAGRVEQVGTAAELRAAPATPYVRELLARARRRREAVLPLALLLALLRQSRRRAVRGRWWSASKPFGESYLLAEMFAQLLEARGVRGRAPARPRRHRDRLRRAPQRRDRRLSRVHRHRAARDSARAAQPPTRARCTLGSAASSARRWGVRWLPPLGFENTYAIAVRRETAGATPARTLSDLARVGPELRAGLTPDFIGRPGRAAGPRARLRAPLRRGARAARPR